MSVIFLDIDGVLCTPLSVRLDWIFRRPMDRQLFDPIALGLLRCLVRRTGARVVLSSSWRYGFEDKDPFTRKIMSNFCHTLQGNGTPVWDLAPILGRSKGEEIAAWLAGHPGTDYVILDDRADEFTAVPLLQPRLVLVDSRRGFRRADCRRALALLSSGSVSSNQKRCAP